MYLFLIIHLSFWLYNKRPTPSADTLTLTSFLPSFAGNLQDGVISDEDAWGWVNAREKDR